MCRRPIFFLTLHVGKTGEQRNGEGERQNGVGNQQNRVGNQQNRVGKGYRGAGIELFQIVLGLMSPGALSGGDESQIEAKSRRFGMDLPFRAFYEG